MCIRDRSSAVRIRAFGLGTVRVGMSDRSVRMRKTLWAIRRRGGLKATVFSRRHDERVRKSQEYGSGRLRHRSGDCRWAGVGECSYAGGMAFATEIPDDGIPADPTVLSYSEFRPIGDVERSTNRFEVVSEFTPSGDQPTAIAELAEGLLAG